jgi:signal transduction histidine kinase/ligand-binding sensor domain-containing protein
MKLQAKLFRSLRISILCLLLVVSLRSYEQLNSGNLTQYTERDGLPGVQVNSILVDKHGYLWVGTINGLARYDGYEFKRFYYNPNDTASVHGLVVFPMLEDRHGKIWIGTNQSYLNAYDPVLKKFRQYEFAHLIKHTADLEVDIAAMCEDNNGRIYFGATTYYGQPINSALLYKDEKDDDVKRFEIPDSLDVPNVLSMVKDQSGNIWCTSFSAQFQFFGLFRIDTKGNLHRVSNAALNREFIANNELPNDFKFDKDGHMWMITTGDRLIDYDVERNTFRIFVIPINSAAKNNFVRKVIAMDKEDNLWLGTDDGVKYLNRKTGQFSSFNNGVKKELEHAPVNELRFDSFGTLWIGTNSDGLLKYEDRPQLTSYLFNKADKNSLTPGWVNCIYEARDGKIWVGTGGYQSASGINIIDLHTGAVERIPVSTMLSSGSGVSAMWENSPNEIYLSIDRSVFAISPQTHKSKPVKLAGVSDTITVLSRLKDSRQNEWLCTTDGLYNKKPGADQFKRYDLSKVQGGDEGSNQVTGALESKKYGVWLITNNGLFLYDYDTDKIEKRGYDKKWGDIFATQDINSFYEDPNGVAWVGTWQGGLSRYDLQTKKIKTYTSDDGLPSMSVQSILADQKNNSLWLSTFDGLSRFDIKTGQFSNFSIADGIQGQLFADGARLATSGGLFAFGGSNGVTIFNPDEVNKNSIPPKVFLTDVKLFNKSIVPGDKSILKKPIDETDQITLSHGQNNLSIEFIAIHYSNSSKNRYSYKLENYDNEWRDVGNQHVAFYPNLPPGEYTFRVKASNDKGIWNEHGATLKISINPPWWKTTWAYVLYGIAVVLAAFAIDRYFRRRLVQRERERSRSRELEQAKEIEKAYHKLEQTHEALKATQSQLIYSEKMASLGELTAGIAHEIQNPLNFVNNFSEVNDELVKELKAEVEKGNLDQVKAIARDIGSNSGKINHHGKRADAIVKGMLQHSRVSTGQKELTDINALCDEYMRLAYHGFRAKDNAFNIKCETDFDSTIGRVSIVPQEIGRVILNLINNAFYAVNEKLKAHSSRLVADYTPLVEIQTKKLSEKIEIIVKDNGNGIPDSIMEKIFQPFFTTKPTGQGTGLGLSLAYDIVKAHGGEMKVDTKEGEGSEFIIQLPVT